MAAQPPALLRRQLFNGMVTPFAQPTSKPPATFPAAVSTDSNLLIAQNQISTTLTAPITPTSTIITVTDPTAIFPNVVLTLGGSEIAKVISAAGNAITVQRGFDNTVAAAQNAGATITGNVVAYHHNTMVSEVEAIEAALGANMSRVLTLPTACISLGATAPMATICGLAGNVGIGTSTPHVSLEIVRNVTGAVGPTLLLSDNSGQAGAGAAIAFNSTGIGTNPDGQLQAVDDGAFSVNLLFSTKTPGAYANPLVERMRIASTGSVQIGTRSPAASGGQLIVATSATAYPPGLRGIVSAESDNTPDSAVLFLVKSRGTPLAPLPAQVGDFIGYEGHYVTTTNGTVIPGAAISTQLQAVGAGVCTVALSFSTNNGQANPTTRMVIGANGTISFPALPSARPAPGSAQIWYDPSDGDRVKFEL